MAYCGSRTYTTNLSTLLSMSGMVVTLKSNANTDQQTTTGIVSCSLSSYSTVTVGTSSFTVTVNDCILNSVTTTNLAD
jgi:hypothetical protein